MSGAAGQKEAHVRICAQSVTADPRPVQMKGTAMEAFALEFHLEGYVFSGPGLLIHGLLI